MGWDSAKKGNVVPAGSYAPATPMSKEVRAKLDAMLAARVAQRPIPVRDDDDVEMNDEETHTLKFYHKALVALAKDQPVYRKNLNIFVRWNEAQRLKWIYQIEQQAHDGLDTIGSKLMAAVVMLRLEG